MSRKLVSVAWILRLVGLLSMLAILAVFMPLSWMASVHESLGLGKMPEGPIVEYLAPVSYTHLTLPTILLV